MTYSAVYTKTENLWATIGGSFNIYSGDHYGKIIWAQYAKNINPESNYYFNSGEKQDLSFYLKTIYTINQRFDIFGDIQYRNIHYTMKGVHDDLGILDQMHDFDFINPKTGITFHVNDNQKAYVSFSVANREPSRNNFRDADENYIPRAEKLFDYEAGYELKSKSYSTAINFYFMDYTDQLILTGKINNVGSPIMANVPDSYRLGMELMAGAKLNKMLSIDANATFSRNKILSFTEYIDNWDTWGQESRVLGKTDISFSPSVIASARIIFEPIQSVRFTFSAKHVGKQYIDNTSNNDKSLEAYTTANLRSDFTFHLPYIKQASLFLAVNNLFDHMYESNAWVYSYLCGGKEYKMDGYYPQAGINFMSGISLKF
jgi:iron complex outermembrane receptor protein